MLAPSPFGVILGVAVSLFHKLGRPFHAVAITHRAEERVVTDHVGRTLPYLYEGGTPGLVARFKVRCMPEKTEEMVQAMRAVVPPTRLAGRDPFRYRSGRHRHRLVDRH